MPTDTASPSDGAVYSPNNWWYDEPERTEETPDPSEYGTGDTPQTNPGPAGTYHPDPNEPHEIIAHRLLHDTATMLCKRTLRREPWQGGRLAEAIALVFDDDPDFDGRPWQLHHRNEAVELTDPCLRPPSESAQDQRHRKRMNEETGYITDGETTGVVIQDRPLEAFMDVVNLWLEGHRTVMAPREKDHAREYAARMKKQGQLRDVDILAKVIKEVRG